MAIVRRILGAVRLRTLIIVAVLVIVATVVIGPEELRIGRGGGGGGAYVSGKFWDCTGNPFPVFIEFWWQNPSTGEVALTKKVSTNSDGSYGASLSPGKYWVSFYDQEIRMFWPIAFVANIGGSGQLGSMVSIPSMTCSLTQSGPELSTGDGWRVVIVTSGSIAFERFGNRITSPSIKMTPVVVDSWPAIFFPPHNYKVVVTLENTGSSGGFALVKIYLADPSHRTSWPVVQKYVYVDAGKKTVYAPEWSFWDYNTHTFTVALG